MQAQSTIEPTRRRGTILARLWSVVRGDKYMADAYPPDWPGSDAASATHTKDR